MCKLSECKHFMFKHWEYSKKLLCIVWILIVILLPVSIAATFICNDTALLREYIIGAFALASVSHGFYYWKAKNENLHKYGRDEEIRA